MLIRGVLQRFTHIYAFLSQVVSFSDTGLERDYLYARALGLMLPGRSEGRLDLGQEVELTLITADWRQEILTKVIIP